MTSIDYQIPDKDKLKLVIKGKLDAKATSRLWPQIFRKIDEINPQTLSVDAIGIDYCDGAGIALLLELKHTQEQNNRQVLIIGLKSEFEQLMTLFDFGKLIKPDQERASFVRFTEKVGTATINLLQDLKSQVSFTGELFVKLLSSLSHPGSLRWRDTFLIAEKSGVNAIGITALLGFLIGLI